MRGEMRLAARLMLVTSLIAAAPGCTGEGDRVVLKISALGFDAGRELDSVWVTVTASRPGDTRCEPFSEVVSLVPGYPGSVTPPVTVEVRAGALYDQILFVRIEGKRAGTVRVRDERMASLGGGDVRVDVSLAAACLDVGLEQGELCQDGVVAESPYWRIFDEGEGVQPGERCQ
jgi:hypothetical protein